MFKYSCGVSGVKLLFHPQCAKDKIEWHIQGRVQIQFYEPGITDRAKKKGYKRHSRLILC